MIIKNIYNKKKHNKTTQYLAYQKENLSVQRRTIDTAWKVRELGSNPGFAICKLEGLSCLI